MPRACAQGNQDSPFVAAAKRIVGGDLTFPCGPPTPAPGAVAAVTAEACVADDADASSQAFYFNATDSSLRLASQPANLVATGSCDFTKDGNIVSLFAEGAGATKCGGAKWTHNAKGQLIGASSKCLDEYMYTTPRVDLWSCNGGSNENWTFVPSSDAATVGGFAAGMLKNARSGKCLTVSTAGHTDNAVCENIWSRKLANGDVALAMVNQGANATMVCDSACFTAAGLGSASKVKVRDMIAHADLPELSPPFALKALVAGEGSAAAFRLTPAK